MCIFALTSSAVFYPTPKGSDGLRTKKTVNGTTTEYTYASGLLVSQSDPTTTLNFTYSADGIPRAVTYEGTQYYYFYNLQGDVVAIYDSQGSTQVKYTYDTWGKLISVTGTMASTLGAKNPFRYRGYVYDTETGYYYLTTRYYDPETGRFLNADGYISTGEPLTGYNMFAYCYNNPVMYEDSGGSRPIVGDWPNETKEDHIASFAYMQGTNYSQNNLPVSLQADLIGTTSSGTKVYMHTTPNYNVPPNSIKLYDARDTNMIAGTDIHEPNIQAIDSYKITDKAEQTEIISFMLDYCASNPSQYAFDRTQSSLLYEWEIHNNVHQIMQHLQFSNCDIINSFLISTADTDFNNGDEGKGYVAFFYDRILKRRR